MELVCEDCRDKKKIPSLNISVEFFLVKMEILWYSCKPTKTWICLNRNNTQIGGSVSLKELQKSIAQVGEFVTHCLLVTMFMHEVEVKHY